MDDKVWKGVYPQVFGRSNQLLLNKFSDPSTPLLMILEDNLKNENDLKDEDELKILTTLKVTQNPYYCDPFFTLVTLILTKSPNF